jgi:hypothetical protein
MCPECGTRTAPALSSLSGATGYVPAVPSVVHNLDAARFVVQRQTGPREKDDVLRVFAPAWPGLGYWAALGGILLVIALILARVTPSLHGNDRALILGVGGVAIFLGLLGVLVPIASQRLQHGAGDLLRIECDRVRLPRRKVEIAASGVRRVELVSYAATSGDGAHTSRLSDLVLCAAGADGAEEYHVVLTGASWPKRAIGEEVARALGVPFVRTSAGEFRYGQRQGARPGYRS